MTKPLPTLLAALALAALGALAPAAPALARAPEAPPAAMVSAMPVPAIAAPLPSAAAILRHVSATDTTKPAGAALDARRGTRPALDLASHRLDRLIRTAVCTGC